jgi:hypothetical protein
MNIWKMESIVGRNAVRRSINRQYFQVFFLNILITRTSTQIFFFQFNFSNFLFKFNFFSSIYSENLIYTTVFLHGAVSPEQLVASI